MPRVSVVIPVYNAELYLRECLDGVVRQTLEDIEVLCVDDGSTDSSAEILEMYAQRDPRVKVIRQANSGAGAARNEGLDAAQGEYLLFLDADDFCEPTMLEELREKCESHQADIAVCGVSHYHTATGESSLAAGMLKMGQLPEADPFSYRDMPDHILTFCANATWNKLFRTTFVRSNGLRFQVIRRANDYYFTKLALVRAERITIVDKALVNYRVGTESNLQSANHETPLDFFDALVALRGALVEMGVFAEVERSFVNNALTNCLYNLESFSDVASFHLLYERLKGGLFDELGINGRDASYFMVESQYDTYRRVMSESSAEYLFEEARRLQKRLIRDRERISSLSARAAAAESKLKKVQSSRSYRFARRLSGMLSAFGGRASGRGADG